MNKPQNSMPSLLDREISTYNEDAFGHRHYAKALINLIEGNKPPYTIGLLGPWGVGKSSIKEMYLNGLADDSSRGKEKSRKERIQTITFNAWRFGGLDIKRALLRHVYISLGGKEDELNEKLYTQITRNQMSKRSIKDIGKDFLQSYIWYPVQLIMILIVFILCFMFMFFWIKDIMWTTIATAIFTCGATAIWKVIASYKAPLVPLYSNVTKVYPPSTSSEQYIDYLIAQMRIFHNEHSNIERLVIFVDDLDRLTAEEMVSALDAVRIFMDIPRELIPKGLGIVFIVSCDEDKVASALENKRNGKEVDKQEARRYLDRIFQFRLEIPPMPKRDMRSYARAKIIELMPDIEKELETSEGDLSGVIDRLIHVKVQNPRNAVQLVNSFAQSWWIAKQREWDGSGSERAGGLIEGTITRYPVILAIINALKIDFHFFYEDLIEEPNLLSDFKRVFIQHIIEDLSSSKSRTLLKKYGDVEKFILNDEYKYLRQYIASLQGVKMPKTLQPFILLSQDSISRKIGDNTQIYDALVSADVQGFLDEMNEHSVTDKFRPEHVGTINDIIEELFTESSSRVENTAFVLGKLANRLDSESRNIISFICSKLIEISNLRYRLTIEGIADVMQICSRDEKRDIAYTLIDDFLIGGSEIKFKTPDGEKYSLEEMEAIIIKVVPMVLRVYSEVGLAEKYENYLIRWLKERKVSIGNEETIIDFDYLHFWFKEFKQLLFRHICSEYANECLKQIKVKGLTKFDGFVDDFKIILNHIWSKGDESRNVACELIAIGFEVTNEEIIQLSSSFFVDKFSYLETTQVNLILSRYIDRLLNGVKSDVWKLNKAHELSCELLDVIEQFDGFSSEVINKLADLVNTWSWKQGNGVLACNFIDVINMKNTNITNSILSEWIERLFDNLEEDCKIWLGNNIGKVEDNVGTALFQKFNLFLSPGQQFLDKQLNALNVVLNSIDEDGYKCNIVTQYLSQLFSVIGSYYTTNSYIMSIFPIVSSRFKYITKIESTRILNSIFVSGGYVNNTQNFSSLSEDMIGKWDVLIQDSSEAINIFNTMYNYINSYYTTESTSRVLESLVTFISSESITGDKNQELANSFILLWGQYKEQMSELIKEHNIMLSAQQIAQLYNNTDIRNVKDKDSLIFTWKILIERIDSDCCIEVVKNLLTFPKNTESDFGLCNWIMQNNGCMPSIIDLIESNSINDEQKGRLSYQIILNLEKIPFEELLRFVYISIANTIEGALPVIFDNRNAISSKILSGDKNKFHDRLLLASLVSTNLTYKRNTLQWIIDDKSNNVIKRNRKILEEHLNNETKDVLSEFYPNSKILEKI